MIRVGDVMLGVGRPKIFASITEADRKSVIAAADILLQKSIDIVEWRIDYYKEHTNWESVLDTLQRVKRSLCGKPLLVTFRSRKEGGQAALESNQYRELLGQIAVSGQADMIDVEIFQDFDIDMFLEETAPDGSLLMTKGSYSVAFEDLKKWIAGLKEQVAVIGSYHNFDRTPSDAELEKRMQVILESGVDIPKLALMPQNRMDVLRLMSFTLQKQEALDLPIISMSMGKLGSISRVAGEAFGSAATFGSIGQGSAPGQLPVLRLGEMLEMIHQNYE